MVNMNENLTIAQLIELLPEVDNIIFTTRSLVKKHYQITLFFDNMKEDIRHIFTIETNSHNMEHRILAEYDVKKKKWTKENRLWCYELPNKNGIKKLVETIENMIKAKTSGGLLPYPVAFYYRK
jgi:hypothetical protein